MGEEESRRAILEESRCARKNIFFQLFSPEADERTKAINNIQASWNYYPKGH